jgi:transcriptional regulator with XRE-family HTH domain
MLTFSLLNSHLSLGVNIFGQGDVNFGCMTGTVAMSRKFAVAKEISRRIRQARRLSGLSQADLAISVEVQRSAVSNWEANSSVLPSLNHLVSIAMATDTSLEWLATGRGSAQPDFRAMQEVPAVDGMVTETFEEGELLQRFRYAPVRTRALLLDLINALVPDRPRRRIPQVLPSPPSADSRESA